MSTITARNPRGKNILSKCAAGINKARLTPQEADLVSGNKRFQEGFVALLKSCASNFPDYTLARAILGEAFISPDEVMKSCQITYTDAQLMTLGDTLPAQNILEWCRDNSFMLVAGPPKTMSPSDVCDRYATTFGGWHRIELYHEQMTTEWIMLRKVLVPGSFNKKLYEQQQLLSELEVVSSAAELVWAISVYNAVRGRYLFQGLSMRTTTRTRLKRTAIVSFKADRGLVFGTVSFGSRGPDLGVVSVRK